MDSHEYHPGRARRSADDDPSDLSGRRQRRSAYRDASAIANAAVVAVLNAYLISHSILVTSVVALVAIALAFALG